MPELNAETWGDTLLVLKGRATDLLVLLYRMKAETDTSFSLRTQSSWELNVPSYLGTDIIPKWLNQGEFVPFHKCSFTTDALYKFVYYFLTLSLAISSN
jgi:hypothetical protein